MKTIIEIHEEGQLSRNIPKRHESGVGAFLAAKIDYVDFLISPEVERMRMKNNIDIIANSHTDNQNIMRCNRLKAGNKRHHNTSLLLGHLNPHRIESAAELTGL